MLPPTNCIKKTHYYTVKKGDTLESIAIKANTTVLVIKKLNSMIVDEHPIFAGHILKLPNHSNQNNETHHNHNHSH